MNTVARAFVVAEVESRERKQINGKNLAEFRLVGFGLKLNAWGDLAVKVPESGIVMVEGAIKTRSYQDKNNIERQSSEVTVSAIDVLDLSSADDDDDSPLPF